MSAHPSFPDPTTDGDTLAKATRPPNTDVTDELSGAPPTAAVLADATVATALPSNGALVESSRSADNDALRSAASAVRSQSRWATLYSDALASVFRFAAFEELTQLIHVHRHWRDVVIRMPPLAVPAIIHSEADLAAVLLSHARRHVSSLVRRGRYDSRPCYAIASIVALMMVSIHTPWLTQLHVELPAFVSFRGAVEHMCDAFSRFNKLRELTVEMPTKPDPVHVTTANRVIAAIGGLSPALISRLELSVPASGQVSFAPLCSLPQLRIFRFNFESADFGGEKLPLTSAQIEELRTLASLHQLSSPYTRRAQTDFVVRVLQPGHSLKWTVLGSDLCSIIVTAPLAALLHSLPTLTTLRAEIMCSELQFFAQLPLLTNLDLVESWTSVDLTDLVRSLRPCTQLTALALRLFDLASCHMESLLPAFPALASLTLSQLPQLVSLRCFATSALGASLTRLEMRDLPRCPPSEIVHLFGLRSLRTIIIDSLASALNVKQKAEFAAPSARFPLLTARYCM